MVLLVAGDFNWNPFYLISTMSPVQLKGEEELYHLYSTYRRAYKALPFDISYHNYLDSCSQKQQTESTSGALNTEVVW